MPVFISLEQVLHVHARQIQRYGGDPGLRDQGLLESAVAMPMQGFAGQYLHPTLPEMAAAYLFYLCRNHPFIDGNKRVAAATAELFLRVNAINIKIPDDQYIAFVLAIASSQATKEDAIAFFKKHIPE